ncbi:NAD(P)-binding protein [Mesobacillus maritimus]|uniref:NAD(P)-binding protein n=1 Tax=Mesobacillus maritimus TaxID=1643336 RepID=UPI002041EBAA|nr:NAD(P)-binding protein [Mesobacillus maritimus]MCM3585944.1 NAD(P)-binding protein [Mesobacillus maritimus]MCM3670395.1 NAD(P)-binding protein [Mesobacillus maritimus]
MNEYPAMIKLNGKIATVIGGGTIAERKVKSLLQAGANVIVISPKITKQIHDWEQSKKLTWLNKKFEPTDVNDSFLVIAATDQHDVNKNVREAVNEFQLLNIVDDPVASNFIVPSSFRQGQLTIAVSTSGASPSLAKKIKTELMEKYDETYAEYITFLQQCRSEVKQTVKDPQVRRQILKKLLDDEFIELTEAGNVIERHRRYLTLLKDKIKKGE